MSKSKSKSKKKGTEKPPRPRRPKTDNGSAGTGQAWERGISVPCAPDESAKE